MRIVAWCIFVLAVLSVLFCTYAFLFWGWVTAAPQTPAQLARARYNYYFWLVLAGVSVGVAVADFVLLTRRPRREG